jgi:hypothetical protein
MVSTSVNLRTTYAVYCRTSWVSSNSEDMNKLNVRGYIKSHMVCSYKVMARNIKQFVRLAKSLQNKAFLPDIGKLCPNAS